MLRLRKLGYVPQLWAARIRKLSDTEMKISPRPPRPGSIIRMDPRGGMADHRGFDGRQEHRLEPPSLATVPLAVGTPCGEPMSVGVLLTSQRLSHVGESCLLGIEHVSTDGESTPVYFSPVSGRVFVRLSGVFVRLSGDPEGLVAQPMPPLVTSSAEGAYVQGVEAFALVGASGGISFGRRRVPGDDIEWSGQIPSEFLSSVSAKFFASVTFQIEKLAAPARVCVTWAGDLPLTSVARAGSQHSFSAVWEAYEW